MSKDTLLTTTSRDSNVEYLMDDFQLLVANRFRIGNINILINNINTMIKKLLINNKEFSIVVEQLRLLNSTEEIEIIPNNYFGYFKLSEITPFNYGECFRDVNGGIIFFYSPEELIAYARIYLTRRYK